MAIFTILVVRAVVVFGTTSVVCCADTSPLLRASGGLNNTPIVNRTVAVVIAKGFKTGAVLAVHSARTVGIIAWVMGDTVSMRAVLVLFAADPAARILGVTVPIVAVLRSRT